MAQRILIVEDEQGLRLTLGDRLRNEGYEVETVADGAAGLDRASQGCFDLIVLDLMLPEKSGLDVCRDLRQQGLTTPVLILTARGPDFGQGRRTEDRSRRLRHEAVRNDRASGAGRSVAAP